MPITSYTSTFDQDVNGCSSYFLLQNLIALFALDSSFFAISICLDLGEYFWVDFSKR